MFFFFFLAHIIKVNVKKSTFFITNMFHRKKESNLGLDIMSELSFIRNVRIIPLKVGWIGYSIHSFFSLVGKGIISTVPRKDKGYFWGDNLSHSVMTLFLCEFWILRILSGLQRLYCIVDVHRFNYRVCVPQHNYLAPLNASFALLN